jgi:hypothetical protein
VKPLTGLSLTGPVTPEVASSNLVGPLSERETYRALQREVAIERYWASMTGTRQSYVDGLQDTNPSSRIADVEYIDV